MDTRIRRHSSRLEERQLRLSSIQDDQEKDAIKRFFKIGYRQLATRLKDNVLDDFSIIPWILLAPVSYSGCIDFDIPECWKNDTLPLTTFRVLARNNYKAPIQRPMCLPCDVPLCSCTVESGCDENCMNRLLNMECAPNLCRACVETDSDSDPHDTSTDKYCSNTALQVGEFPRVEVFRTSQCGYGLRLLEDVAPDVVIVEYLGEVITHKECLERMADYDHDDDFYFASLGGGLMLDAKKMGSVARFANHSCMPNTDLQRLNVLGEDRIALVSNRHIIAGTELTYNYQYFDDGLDSNGVMQRQKCCCGSENCSGIIGGRTGSREEDVWLEKAESLLSGCRKYPLETLEEQLRGADVALDAAGRMQPRNAMVINALEGAVLEAKLWQQSVRDALSSETVVPTGVTDSLTRTAPLCVRADEWTQLQSALKARNRAEKCIRQVQVKAPCSKKKPMAAVDVDGEDEGEDDGSTSRASECDDPVDLTSVSPFCDQTKEETGLSTVLVASDASTINVTRFAKAGVHETQVKCKRTNTQDGNLWETFWVAMSAVFDASPLFCEGALSLLESFKSFSEWALRWRDLVSVLSSRPSTKAVDAAEYSIVIKRLSSVYSIKLSDEIFLLSDALDYGIEVYYMRKDLECLEKNRWTPVRVADTEAEIEPDGSAVQEEGCDQDEIEITTNDDNDDDDEEEVADVGSHTSRDLGKLEVQCPLRRSSCGRTIRAPRLIDDSYDPGRKEGKRARVACSKQKATIDDDSESEPSISIEEDLLLCFCRLTEEFGETRKLVECDKCHRWFHPECVNMLSNQAGAGRDFLCPLCLHFLNIPSAFAYEPAAGTGWDVGHASRRHRRDRKDVTRAVVEEAERGQVPSDGKDNVAGESRFIGLLGDATGYAENMDDMANSNQCVEQTRRASVEMSSPQLCVRSLHVPNIAQEDIIPSIQTALESVSSLALAQNPLTKQFSLLSEVATDWTRRVEHFLSLEATKRILYVSHLLCGLACLLAIHARNVAELYEHVATEFYSLICILFYETV